MPEQNKEVIRRWLAFADRGFDGEFGEFIRPDYVGHLSTKTMDVAELERLERAFTAAFSGTSRQIKDLIAENDRVVLRVETTALHTGEFSGVMPTSKKVTLTGIVIYRVEDGRIAESWAEIDFASLVWQLRSA